MHDYEKVQATLKLMDELEKGRKSGEQEGWLSIEDVIEHLRIREQDLIDAAETLDQMDKKIKALENRSR